MLTFGTHLEKIEIPTYAPSREDFLPLKVQAAESTMQMPAPLLMIEPFPVHYLGNIRIPFYTVSREEILPLIPKLRPASV